MKNGTPLWREAHLCVKMYKTPQRRSHFASRDQEKWRAAVARSTFASENAKKLTVSRRSHFASRDPEKWRAAVARSTFASENAKKLTVSEPSWKFRC